MRMAESDWSYLTGGLDIATVDRGPTAGMTTPPGGGSFLFAFHSLAAVEGAVALFLDQAGFTPMPRGGSIRGCIQRGPGSGATGFSPFFFLACQGSSVNDTAYLLGLSDEDPHRIVLRKGTVAAGIPGAGGPGALLASSTSIAQGAWLHLRLDVIANDNGDVVLNVFQNDLDAHPILTPPDWQPIPGMPRFIDDHLGINSGSQPLIGGRGGFGMAAAEVTRRAFFDHLELLRQV
jgi:hypothetical protein